MDSIELCAGAGGQALGLERAGFDHQALVEIDESCRQTLSLNRRDWNVVPGRIAMTIDLRHPEESLLDQMHAKLMAGIFAIDQRRVGVAAVNTWHSPVVRFDPDLAKLVRDSACKRSYPAQDIVSGAGHDAFHLARVVPTKMIFVPCRDGVSHNEREYASPEHVAAGANVLLDVVLAQQADMARRGRLKE